MNTQNDYYDQGLLWGTLQIWIHSSTTPTVVVKDALGSSSDIEVVSLPLPLWRPLMEEKAESRKVLLGLRLQL